MFIDILGKVKEGVFMMTCQKKKKEKIRMELYFNSSPTPEKIVVLQLELVFQIKVRNPSLIPNDRVLLDNHNVGGLPLGSLSLPTPFQIIFLL